MTIGRIYRIVKHGLPVPLDPLLLSQLRTAARSLSPRAPPSSLFRQLSLTHRQSPLLHPLPRFMCAALGFTYPSANTLTSRRFYRPDRNIDWVGIKTRWRAKQVLQKKRKLKNHPRVAMRFRLTRFGWERLQTGRNSRKFNLTRQQYRNKMRVKYVSRCDLKKLTRQMPGFRLRYVKMHEFRIRDPPINNNPNARNIRRAIGCYFG